MGDIDSNVSLNTDFEGFVRDFLPERYNYKVEKCEVTDRDLLNPKFLVEFRVDVDTEQDLKTFLSDFNSSSGCTFNTKSGRQDRRQDSESDTARSRYSTALY